MKRFFLFLCIAFLSLHLFSQSKISGFIPVETLLEEDKVVDLIQVNYEASTGKESIKVLTSTSVNDKGFFRFDEKLPTRSTLYYLSIGRNVIQSKKFLIGNEDSVHFQKGFPPLTQHISNSVSDKEWQKLVKFRNRIGKEKKFLDEIRTYSKDSLQILAVKLMSVRELENKRLLDKDIALNGEYYSTLLSELKESDINPQEYLFLELKLTKLQVVHTEENYAMSKWLNIALGILVIGMFFWMFRSKNSKDNLAVLSKQETVIKDLILQKKSNKEIASELFISVSTVKTHVTNIYQKLHVVNRNELITKFKNSTGTST